jgi:chromosomal replication initiation ATPase DnaA
MSTFIHSTEFLFAISAAAVFMLGGNIIQAFINISMRADLDDLTSANDSLCTALQAETSKREQATNYTLFSIQVKDSRRPVAEARQIMAYTLRRQGMTLHEIGRIIARHHSVVVHCLKVVENNPRIFNAQIKEIQNRLNAK